MYRSAQDDYVAKRSNGSEVDNPPRPFPGYGQSSWENPYGRESRVRYNESPKDREWMEEKDRNYLARLEREGTLREQEPEVWAQRERERTSVPASSSLRIFPMNDLNPQSGDP